MRINTGTTTSSITTTATLSAPVPVVTCGGAGGYTVTIPDPRGITGFIQAFYNSSSGIVTLSTPSGSIIGPGTSNTATFAMPAGSVASFVSYGTNYVITSNAGGVTVASTGTFNEVVTASPSNAPVTISPTGSGTVAIAPATAGTLNNVTIGASTAAAGTFTNLAVSGTASGTAFSTLYGAAGAVGSTTAGTGGFTALTATGTTTFQQLTETMVPVASPGSGTAQSYTTGDVFYITAMSANFIFNLTDVPTTTNRNIVVTLYLSQGSTPYYCNSFQINGVGQTIRWPGGVVGGTGAKVGFRTDVQTFNLTRTSGGSWVVTSTTVSYNEPITRSGLYILLDAADTTSYPGTGTNWNDLSGGGNNFIVQASAFNASGPKYFDFNGSYGCAKHPSNGLYEPIGVVAGGKPQNATVCVWTRVLNNSASWRTLIRGKGPFNNDHNVIFQSGGWQMGMYDNINGTGFNDCGVSQQSIPGNGTTTWAFLTFRWSASSTPYMTITWNDTPGTVRGSNNSANSRFKGGIHSIGAYGNETAPASEASQYFGDIGKIAIYNRSLSDAEVLLNFAADRSRFGI
jgi:hypothetical protein